MDIRHTITRFGATALIGCGLAVTAIPATFAQNGEESVTYVYSDKATSHISEVWYKGETLKITGEGFLTQDGTSGSTIAIKLNKGTVKIDGKDYLEVQADEKGNFSVSIPWQDDLDERISVDVYLLSGSLKDNDTARGGKAATVKIQARSVQEATPSATASASASATASVVATPSASVTPSASATASATAADEVVASVDAKIKDRAEEKASATASVSPSATASASVVATPSASATASASASASAAADQNAVVANEAKDQLGDSTSATEQVTASAESTRFANCAEVAAAGLAPMHESHPDFRKKFDNDGNGLGCEVINSEVTNGSSSNDSSGSSSRNSGGLDNLGGDSSSSSSYTSSRAQRSSLANTGASNAFTIAGMGLVALGLGVAGVTAVRNRKNS
ncbi:excalibur calcium-binding domain-containing protein [Rothia sp. (in: high G+C Gram-positive bacteria)]|uniref:excalibur calcium-binding domain-containing protein n=1 Tax=Rothia sp. (in: high G+C Gram-positive bacteria) TaxID=1885016 RepID=UPI001CB0CB60|nr:excalibur calcium-binding domain-containing protein [Rothia sp. (in: high G+C Gram-positive bacteria)]MBF1655072.1 excalibur calcium-binding domain-containing protein [Rothia sp. (in: high G+C Gram-positive bacteria)]